MGSENTENKKAVEYLQQASALRKIASEMMSYDSTSAQNLTELAGEYEEKATRLTEAEADSSHVSASASSAIATNLLPPTQSSV